MYDFCLRRTIVINKEMGLCANYATQKHKFTLKIKCLKSTLAKHALTMGHTIRFDATEILFK